MADYISRDDALLHSEIIRAYTKDYGNIDVVPVEYLADIPAADVQPVKRGKWLSKCEGDIYDFSECSECGNTESCETPYCAQCGARMDKS